jgi:diguanylate cyclase (GGDEF)-like protein/PAS domain S-box-containing protein
MRDPLETNVNRTERLDDPPRLMTPLIAAERKKLFATLAAVPDALITLDRNGRVEYLNDAAEKLTGVSLERARKMHVSNVVQLCDGDGHSIDLPIAEQAAHRQTGSGHLLTRGGTVDVSYVASRIETSPPGTLIVLRDVTTEHRLALRLSFEALHDPLTGLPNRRAVLERIEDAIRGARERGEHHAVAFVDLDNFKAVNDRFGHAVGDRVLADLARVMGGAVRAVDVIARIGGDEFVMLLSNCRLADARHVTDKVRDAVLAYAVEHEAEMVPIGASIGLAPIEAATASAEDAIAAADAACYQIKSERHASRTIDPASTEPKR